MTMFDPSIMQNIKKSKQDLNLTLAFAFSHFLCCFEDAQKCFCTARNKEQRSVFLGDIYSTFIEKFSNTDRKKKGQLTHLVSFHLCVRESRQREDDTFALLINKRELKSLLSSPSEQKKGPFSSEIKTSLNILIIQNI